MRVPSACVAALAGLLVAVGGACAQTDCDRDVCIERVDEGDRVTFDAINRSDYSPVGVKIWFELSGMAEEEQTGPVTIQPGERKRIVRIVRVGTGSYRWQYWYRWNHGTVDPEHDDSVEYLLPWASGETIEAGQGCNKNFSHKGKRGFASDFWMGEGTPVHAARGGTVIHTEARYNKGGNDPAFGEKANQIRILHEDETVGIYMHLRQGGVAVEPGDEVQAGDLIGYSGNTGFSTAPHLHFEVFGLDSDLEWNSIDITYETADGPVNCPDYGQSLTAQ